MSNEADSLFGLTASGTVWRAIIQYNGILQWTDLHAPEMMIDLTAVPHTPKNWETAYTIDRNGTIWELIVQQHLDWSRTQEKPFKWNKRGSTKTDSPSHPA